MQITVKEAKVVKTGTSGKGEWELIRVLSEDNTEYTTFDKKAKHLTGAVIEFEPVIKEGKCSFKEFTVITAAPTAAPAGNGDQMSKEEWADKQSLERASIEAQTVFKGTPELVKTLAEYPKSELAKAAERWAMGKLNGQPTTKPLTPTTKEKPTTVTKLAMPENIGEVLTKAASEPAPAAVTATLKPSEGFTTTNLFDWVAENMKWKNSKAARTWIVNVCSIPEERIDSDPVGVMAEIAQLQGWE